MNGIVLTASGYAWTCPECGRQNYTGAAPGSVTCLGCRAEWTVVRLAHRKAETSHRQASLLDLAEADAQTELFAHGRPTGDGSEADEEQ